MKRSAIDRFVRSGKHRIALLSALAVVLNAVIIPFGQLLPGRVITAAAAGPTINEYAIPTANSGPDPAAKGPDNNIWFLEQNTAKAGSVSTIGAITEYSLPTAGVYNDVVTGSDGNL